MANDTSVIGSGRYRPQGAQKPSETREPAAVTRSSTHVPQLDGLRGMAIFLVMAWHYVAFAFDAQSGPIAQVLAALLKLSWSGVDLFFVLSGFLIGGILYDNRNAQNYFSVFYARRSLRILPLYLLWLFGFCILLACAEFLPLSAASIVKSEIPVWSYFTFAQNLLMFWQNTFGTLWMGITWSLAVEEQFYLALPLVVRYLDFRRLPWALVVCVFAAPLLRVILSDASPSGALGAYVLMPCRADALLLGALCAWIVRQEKFLLLLKTHTRSLYLIFVILLGGTVFLATSYNPYISTGWPNLGYTWIALLYSCGLLIAITETRGILKTITTISFLRGLGKIAYCVYLIHSVMLYFAQELISQMPKIHYVSYVVTLASASFATWLLATLSWKYIEQPLLAMGHRLVYRQRPSDSSIY